MPRKPTLKQEKAASKTLAYLGGEQTPPKKEILLESGYSPAVAKNPDIVYESKGFQELIKEYLPDDLLAERHQELLNKREVVKTFSHATGETEVELTNQPDTQAVSKALDMAYKLKGSYAPDKSLSMNVNVEVKDNPRALELAKEYEEKLLETIKSDDQA